MAIPIRDFQVMVMDTNSYTDEQVETTFKQNMYDVKWVDEASDVLEVFRKALWWKINSENRIFRQSQVQSASH